MRHIILLHMIVLIMSCDPGSEPLGCTDETREIFVMPTILEDYFGMYQEGNWWVYYNEDSTKMDSLFVTDYEDEVVQAEFQCEQSVFNYYRINSTYLSPQSRPLIALHSGGNCCNWSVDWLYEDNGGFIVSVREDNGNLVFNLNPSSIELSNNIHVNMTTYNDVLSMRISSSNIEDRVYFAKGIGLIRFKLSGEIFNLKKYQIQ